MLNWIYLFILSIIWGSSFILMKKGLAHFSPLQIAAIRNSIPAIIFLPFFYTAFKKHKRFAAKIFFSAMLGSGIPSILFAVSAGKLDSAANGILNALTPIFTLIFGVLIFKNTHSSKLIFGIILGFLGVGILVQNRDVHGSTQWIYALLPISATIMYGVNMNFVKQKLSHIKPIELTSLAYTGLAIPALVYLCFSDFFSKFQDQSIHVGGFMDDSSSAYISFLYIFILGFFGSGISSVIYYRLVQRTSALFASTSTFLMPIVSLFWGALAGETIGWVHFFSMLCILGAVYVVRK